MSQERKPKSLFVRFFVRMDDVSKSYSANALNNARWLKRAVEQRNSTTLKISAEIIRQQTEFLLNKQMLWQLLPFVVLLLKVDLAYGLVLKISLTLLITL